MPATNRTEWEKRLKSRAFNHKVYPTSLKTSGAFIPEGNNREEMILKYTPLIKYIAHRLAMRLPPHISVEDLMSAGVIGLMDALNKFDPEKKVQFKTYAEFRIKGAMLDELRSLDWVSRSVRQKAAQLEKACQTLEKKRGRAAEDEEVAEEMGLSLDGYYNLVNEVNGVFLLDIENVRHKIPKLPEEDLINLLIDDQEKQPLHLLGLEELKKVLAEAIEELTPKEKTVISLYYYEELTLKEIGEVMGFTESRICQVHAKAILKLRTKIRSYMRDSI
jgi:RNA polymerase sigma factor for flagellar operon FliA